MLRERGSTLLFSRKCLFLWDLAGSVEVNHGPLSHLTGGGFILFVFYYRPVLVSSQDVKPHRPCVVHLSTLSHCNLNTGHGIGAMAV